MGMEVSVPLSRLRLVRCTAIEEQPEIGVAQGRAEEILRIARAKSALEAQVMVECAALQNAGVPSADIERLLDDLGNWLLSSKRPIEL